MLVGIRAKLSGTERRVLPILKIKVLENDRLLDAAHYVLYHTRTLSHFLLDITETFYCRSAIIDEIINAQTAQIF